MKQSFFMTLDNIELHPLEIGDIEQLRILRNQNRQCFVYAEEISKNDQYAWYEKYLVTPGDYMFSIYYQQQWIGAVALYNAVNGEAEFGRLVIDRKKVDRGGLGVQVARAACKFGFEELRLVRIYLEVFDDNVAARKTYERTGFHYTGRTREEGGRQMVEMELLEKDLA